MRTARKFMVIFALLATLIAAPPPEAAAAPPVTGDSLGEPTKRVFIPNSGYVRSTRAANLRRRAAERGRANFAPGRPLDVRGTRSIPVICIEFTEDGTDVAPPFPIASYDDLLFGTANPASLTAYYRDISQGKLNATGRVVGWYKAPKDDGFYENGAQGDGPPFGELLKFGLEKADVDLDFGQFDNDGDDGIPNSGDDDGKVDTVFFIHPEHGAECDDGPNIWSHSWHYSEPNYGNGGRPFVTQDVRLGRDGHALIADGVPQKILVEDYTIQPALACDGTTLVDVGVYCHEYGHALGLPDLYDRTPNGNPDSHGIGNWCLMAGGSYGGDGENAQRPTHMSAWCKYYLGWSNLQTLTGASDVEIEPTSVRNDMLRIVVPDTGGLEYFLIEYRKSGPTIGPGGGINWDQFLRADGLLVWHIDERVGAAGNAAWPFAGFDVGQNDSPVRLFGTPPPIFKTKRPLVALIQSDGQMHLDLRGNPGDASDPYKNATTFDDDATGKAGSRGYDGKATGASIKSIDIKPNFVAAKVTAATTGTGGGSPILAGAPPVAAAPPALSVEVTAGLTRVAAELRAKIGDDPFGESRQSADLPSSVVLSDADRAIVVGTTPQAARQVLAFEAFRPYARLSSQLRTQTLSADFAATNEMESGAKALLAKSNVANAQLRLSADGKRVSQLTGLQIESTADSLGADAQKWVTTDDGFRKTFGMTSDFTRITENPESRTQVFRQNVAAGAAKLPVFGADVKLFYDASKKLTSATSSAVSISGEVQGATATLTEEEARQAASEAVGIPADVVTEISKGVLAVPTPAGQRGHVAYEVKVPMGENQEPLNVYIDAASKKVLEIR
jgi:M6 family metalloprotease-like protein